MTYSPPTSSTGVVAYLESANCRQDTRKEKDRSMNHRIIPLLLFIGLFPYLSCTRKSGNVSLRIVDFSLYAVGVPRRFSLLDWPLSADHQCDKFASSCLDSLLLGCCHVICFGFWTHTIYSFGEDSTNLRTRFALALTPGCLSETRGS